MYTQTDFPSIHSSLKQVMVLRRVKVKGMETLNNETSRVGRTRLSVWDPKEPLTGCLETLSDMANMEWSSYIMDIFTFLWSFCLTIF